MTKLAYLYKGERKEEEFPGLLEALEFAKNKGIRGAWFQMFPTSEWESVDKFMEAGARMFGSVQEGE